jgi:PadR family transcriptional regulator PadR
MRGETLKGHLDVLILAALEPAPQHGYAVIQALRERSGRVFDLPEGTIYPALHRLELAGLLASRWDKSSGRSRRVYNLTRAGQAALKKETSDWLIFSKAVGAVLEG